MIWAGGNGFLDVVPVARVREYELQLLNLLRTQFPELLKGITSTGELKSDNEQMLKAAVQNFTADFTAKLVKKG
jgi:F-type H+-transporting ATPase subunit alpha